MAEQDRKTVNQRSWNADPIESQPVEFTVRHLTTVKNVGTPTEVTEHTWEGEWSVSGKTKLKVALGAAVPEFDNALVAMRQALADARAALPSM
jgi:hypothetical protein